MIQSVGGQPPGGPGGPPPSKPMTEDAKKQVTDILSQYDSENLSSDDMDAINKSFKDAGIRPSGELKSMLEDSANSSRCLKILVSMPKPWEIVRGKPKVPMVARPPAA